MAEHPNDAHSRTCRYVYIVQKCIDSTMHSRRFFDENLAKVWQGPESVPRRILVVETPDGFWREVGRVVTPIDDEDFTATDVVQDALKKLSKAELKAIRAFFS